MAGSRVDEQAMKLGLLMETAQAHQQLADASLNKLQAHTHDLDAIIREEVRRTLTDELQALSTDSRLAAQALQAIGRAANVRVALWSIGITTLCSGIASGAAWWVLPSQAQIAALRAKHDELATQISRLEQHGGRIDLRRCGEANRLCVRIDRKAPAYGAHGDYFIVKGN
jgi:hypothetical protein